MEKVGKFNIFTYLCGDNTKIDSKMIGKIYILKDPQSNIIRYVGLTKLSLDYRLSLHLKEKHKVTHKSHWIQSLKKQGLKPIIEQIDIADTIEELCNKEMYWINYYLDLKIPLTNTIITHSNKPYKSFLDKTAKKMIQYDLLGNKIAEYNSGYEAACKLGNCEANGTIYSIANGTKKYTYKNFVFRYEGDAFNKYKIIKKGEHITSLSHKKYLSDKAKERNSLKDSNYYKQIRSMVKTKSIIEISTGIEFNSIKEAIKITGKSRNFFWKNCCNKVKKPKFKFKDIVQST